MQVRSQLHGEGCTSDLVGRYQHFAVAPTTSKRSQPVPDGLPRSFPEPIKSRLLSQPGGVVSTPYTPPALPQWVDCDIRTFDYSVLGQSVARRKYKRS
jgi:mRNA (2'-O-methyladenosine-N6-)-methyltransferase